MKVLLKTLFLALTLTILGYSAMEAGAPWMFTAYAHTCCNYQVDCPASQNCKDVFPDCSANIPHECKAATELEIE
jgi:hypothetical protein